jgi:hypothetical protein
MYRSSRRAAAQRYVFSLPCGCPARPGRRKANDLISDYMKTVNLPVSITSPALSPA